MRLGSKIVVATGNAGKLREFRSLFATGAPELGAVSIEGLAEHPTVVMPEETGETFAANARLKAEHVAQATGLPALADDSGLAVEALGGRPGVRSARYAPGTDRDRYEKLLAEMSAVPDGQRGAAFVCALAFAVPGRETVVVEGRLEGRIARAPSGGGGFGYDPVFVVAGGDRTLAELETEAKGEVSHRGRALRVLFPHIERFFA